MYFSYVPSIIFSFFNHPLFLNLLFKQILIQYYSFVSLFTTQKRISRGARLRRRERDGDVLRHGRRLREVEERGLRVEP